MFLCCTPQVYHEEPHLMAHGYVKKAWGYVASVQSTIAPFAEVGGRKAEERRKHVAQTYTAILKNHRAKQARRKARSRPFGPERVHGGRAGHAGGERKVCRASVEGRRRRWSESNRYVPRNVDWVLLQNITFSYVYHADAWNRMKRNLSKQLRLH